MMRVCKKGGSSRVMRVCKKVRNKLVPLSQALKANRVPNRKTLTRNDVPILRILFGHHIVYFGATHTYRMFRDGKKLGDYQGSTEVVARKIVGDIRFYAKGGSAIFPPNFYRNEAFY
ncbi:hypothetical protein U2F10_03165 [Leptothoe sp. EHU-05/26/07-4]